jgi:hypothetical protein
MAIPLLMRAAGNASLFDRASTGSRQISPPAGFCNLAKPRTFRHPCLAMAMISRRKERDPVTPALLQCLFRFDRLREIPPVYDDLTRFEGSMTYKDP